MTSTAVCENSHLSPAESLPVTCAATHLSVRLPLGTKLIRIKALGKCELEETGAAQLYLFCLAGDRIGPKLAES